MAIVTRKDAEGPVYYVANKWNGRQKSERVGRNRREAERRDAAMKKEIAAGTYQPPGERPKLLVCDIVGLYHAKRTIKSAHDEQAYSRNHMEPREWLWRMPANEMRPAHCDRLIAELRATLKPDGKRRLTDKTIMDVLQLLKRVFASAIRAELCDRQPVVLEHGVWDHTPQKREPYTAAEVVVLISHHLIPWPTRVLIALWMLAGLRQGEGCGLKWKRLDLHSEPLAGLELVEQWRGETLKTKKGRSIPVHQALLAILREWGDRGFELYTGRKPTPEDYIVPELNGFGDWDCFGKHTSYRRFIDACELVGIRPRTLHSCRHTFVTLCRRGGARADVLERVSHNASGKMIDRYTHFDWAPLCEAVSCLRLESFERPPEPPALGGNGEGDKLPELPESEAFPADTSTGASGQLVVCRPRQSRIGLKTAESATEAVTVQANAQAYRSNWGGNTPHTPFAKGLRLAARNRESVALAVAELDPVGGGPGHAVTQGLRRVLDGDVDAARALLRKEAIRRG